MTKDKALKLALETLEGMNHEDSIFRGEFGDAITAIKEALAQRDALFEALKEIVDAADGKGWEQLDPSFKTARAALKAVKGVKHD